MRFLVTTTTKFQIPPEAAPQLFEAMSGWVERNTASGVLEQVWSNAGGAGGGGIANVADLEALDVLMATFPFAAFSEIQVQPLVELRGALQRTREALAARAAG